MGDQRDAKPLSTHRATIMTHKHPCLEWMERTISVLGRVKTFHTLERWAIVCCDLDLNSH